MSDEKEQARANRASLIKKFGLVPERQPREGRLGREIKEIVQGNPGRLYIWPSKEKGSVPSNVRSTKDLRVIEIPGTSSGVGQAIARMDGSDSRVPVNVLGRAVCRYKNGFLVDEAEPEA